MRKKITCLLYFVMMFAFAIQAQTSISYYVDGSQATNGTGTLASPFNRIWYAINTTRDTTKETLVYIKAGRYTIDPNDFSTQLYIGAAQGSGGGKYLTVRTYAGDEGKVIIDGSNLTTNPYYPSMLVISSARYVKLQNLVFRNLKNTNGYVLNIQNSQSIQVNNCAFDSLYWTTTSAEYGYPTVGTNSNFIDAVYLSGSTTVSFTGDTLRNAAPGWGELVRDAGGNTSLTKTSLVTSNVTAVASDYYVATTGNDTTGSGSVSKPWRTIQKANQTAGINYTYATAQLINAPVTINLRAGTHKPTGSGIYIGSNRGTNNQWYTIKNYPGEAPVVDGSNLTDKFSALISIASAQRIRIEGLKLTKVTNDSLLQYAAPSAGTKDTRFGIIVSGQSKYIIIKKNKIYDMAWTRNTTLQKTPTGVDNLNPLVVLGTTDTAIRNVIIDSNEVYNNVPGFAEAVSINGYVDSFAVTHNTIHDNANIGVVAAGNYKWVVNDPVFTVTTPNNYSRNGFILSNEVYRNISPYAVSAGIYLDGSRNVLVEDNESYENGTGISVGNEQDSSISGYHTINSNVFRENLTAGVYYGSTNHTSWVEHCTFKNNTIENNYVLDADLRAKANNQYGITDASQRYTEVNFYRIRNSMFKQNTIESLSNIVLGFYFTQSADTLKYNEYYVISEDACQAAFVVDMNNDGSIAGPPVDSIYFGFHKYALRTGYDQTSACEGQEYDPYGCGNTSGNRIAAIATSREELPADESNISIKAWPNPVVNELFVKLSLQQSGTVTMQLTDLSGRTLLQQQQQLAQGVHQLSIKGIRQRGVTYGVYLLRIITPGETKTIKIAVQ
jgi:hypothetical protein